MSHIMDALCVGATSDSSGCGLKHLLYFYVKLYGKAGEPPAFYLSYLLTYLLRLFHLHSICKRRPLRMRFLQEKVCPRLPPALCHSMH